MYDILELSKKLLPELKDIAKELKIKKAETLKKQDLIYKILDQQAIETTEAKIPPKNDEEEIQSSSEINNQESDSAMRRGKRPRTLTPVVKRPIESVMSVSPDGVKRPETRLGDRQDQIRKPEKSQETPDLFKKPELYHDNRKAPKWRTDQRHEEKFERKERSDNEPSGRYERSKNGICS